MTEAEYLKTRKGFAIFDGKLNWCPDGISSREWLVDSGLFSEEAFNNLVRGCINDAGIYFYQGDFQTNDYVEDVAKSWYSCISESKPVFCGAIKGKPGECWTPIKQIV